MESVSETLLLQETTLPVASRHLLCNCLEPAGHSQLTLNIHTRETRFQQFCYWQNNFLS